MNVCVLRVSDDELGSITWAPTQAIHPDSHRRLTCLLGMMMMAIDMCSTKSIALNGACSDEEKELVDLLEAHFQ